MKIDGLLDATGGHITIYNYYQLLPSSLLYRIFPDNGNALQVINAYIGMLDFLCQITGGMCYS